MKLLYIALCNLEDESYIGIKKKVQNQMKCFMIEYDTFLITQNDCFVTFYHNDVIILKKALLTFEDMYSHIYTFIKENDIDNIYMRYLRTNLWLNDFLKKLKKIESKVVLEFPTIPYDIEIQGSIEIEEDKLYRKKLKRYVSMSTNYNGLHNVFRISSIPLHNGIDINKIPLKKQNRTDEITLIAVATMNYWHGYDRLIKGLGNYYKNKDVETRVNLVLIGDGNEISKYHKLVKQFELESYVEFKGAEFGQELDDEFDNANIAVGTLGMHRNNADAASPIKTKEYCARGIPIILGHNDLAFQSDLPFIHRVANDNSDIDIFGIIEFHKDCKNKYSCKAIREYAEENLTWEKIMSPVKKYYNSNGRPVKKF